MLNPTEVHLLNFCSDIGSSTSIPCLRQYFAVMGIVYFPKIGQHLAAPFVEYRVPAVGCPAMNTDSISGVHGNERISKKICSASLVFMKDTVLKARLFRGGRSISKTLTTLNTLSGMAVFVLPGQRRLLPLS